MSVHYRFKSALEYDTITFDALHISVKDLKNAIIQQKRIGKSTDFDLRITNAQTEEVYDDDNALIPKNTSLLIARVPVTAPKQKQWEGYGGSDTPPSKVDENSTISKATDLTNLDAPEEDKIRAMMSQSTQDYDPSNYMKIRGSNQVGPVPLSYRCFKCHQSGHWIKDCPLGQGVEPLEIKKSTGIPHSFLVPVEGPQVPGAMMTSNGQYAVPALDLQAYTQKQASAGPVHETKPDIPEDLLCSICSDLLTDAVMIPCCGNSFCDECIRSVLLESEEHECPDCHEKDISPATLIPNRFLRKSVANFKNTTGYEKKPVFKHKPDLSKESLEKKMEAPPPEVDSTENDATKQEEKTVISEADSTEYAKNNDLIKEPEPDTPKTSEPEGPPGVSPRQSPVHKITSKVSTGGRDRSGRDKTHYVNKKSSPKHRRSRSPSPRKPRNRRSPSFERRPRSPDTPTRDDFPPGLGGNYAVPPPHTMPSDVLPSGGMPPGPMQGPPPGMPHGGYPPGQPPYHVPQGVAPNFRLPPPGTQPPPYMPPGSGPYGTRPVFDPMVGPPGGFGPSYPGRPREFAGRRGGRDRTPPGLIDDPLAAFNRILREKDEKRARQQRMARRSWSRSRSRSFSRSPPPLRRRSRSPRRRKSRSRSRSFSMSRSRSHSYSPRPSPRGSPLAPSRRPSPPPQAPRRGRFRSPIRSSPPRRRQDRVEFDRDYDRPSFREKASRGRRADSRERFYDDRERDYGRNRGPAPSMGGQPAPLWAPPRDPYYPEQAGGFPNRYPQQIHHIQAERKFEPIPQPEVDQPPVPGLESELPLVEDFDKQRHTPPRQEREERDRDKKEHHTRDSRERRNKEVKTPPPEKHRNTSPKKSATPERGRKRRSPSVTKEDKRRDKDTKESRHRDQSDEDKKSKGKDKKKHKDKKDDKKKKKDKKDKHHKSKERTKKEEFKQVIPKVPNNDEDPDEIRKKIEERRKLRGEEEKKRQEEERKKEERRLRFMEDEKKKREEEARKEEAKRKAIEEARKILEKEEVERRRLEKEKKEEELRQKQKEEELKREEELRQQEQEMLEQEELKVDLYDQVISEQDIDKEVKVVEPAPTEELIEKEVEDGEVTDEHLDQRKLEDEDVGILELHPDLDIKLDESDILAPVPEKSRWEVDEEVQHSPNDSKEFSDPKLNKVSSEVLKRAENVIFARAINSIRPLEIKKVGGERVKVYAEEKPGEEPKKIEVPVEKPRLSVKERLGKKVDDPDPKVILIETRRSHSPFNRRERRIEVERRHDRRDRSKDRDRHSRPDRSSDKNKKTHTKRDEREEKSRDRRKRTRSPSEEPRKRRKDKKAKKDKGKKHAEEHKSETSKQDSKPKSAVDKRKSTLDEANFEPDYDLEVNDDESDKDGKRDKERKVANQGESSSSETSTSSSEEDKKKKRRKVRKKKKKKDSSSSESESSSESSESDKERKRKKHKRTKRKKKKSKHK